MRSLVPRLERRNQGLDERRGKNPFTGERIVIPGRSPTVSFFEAELQGNEVAFATGGTGQPTRQRTTVFESEDEAYAAYAKALVAKQKRGFIEVGAAREIDDRATEPVGSSVLLDVYFSAGDPRFLEELLRARGTKRLAGLAAGWFADARPFARHQLLAYVEDGCCRFEHKALVKRLFKLAEAAKDHELMARFLVAFDRWNRRSLQTVGYRWEPATHTAERELGLREDPLVIAHVPKGKQLPTFSRATRRYLMRRAFRYFRRLGYREPDVYRRVMLGALLSYREEHLNTVGKLFSAWGLLHVLYGRSAVLERNPKGVRLATGAVLTDLKPAPLFPEIWQNAFEPLLTLLSSAGSRTVRAWAYALLRESHGAALATLPLSSIKSLIVARFEEANALGLELFQQQSSLEALSLQDWFELLAVENLEVLAAVCERAAQTLRSEGLTLEQCVTLTLSPAAPLSRLGFEFCLKKPIDTKDALQSWLRCCRAKVEAVRKDAATRSGELLGTFPFATVEQVRDLCDSAYRDVRAVGLSIAAARFAEDVELWTSLCESPYADVRHHVVMRAARFRESEPITLTHVFGTVLLSLQGAAKDKRRVAQEMVTRIEASPERARDYLPLLRATLRSIHPAERVFALSALARAAVKDERALVFILEEFPEFSVANVVSQ